MAWIYVIIGGFMDIGWALGLKFTKGFSQLGPSIFTIILIILSFAFFAKAMKALPIGTAYAVFTGIASAGTVILGMMFLGESAGIGKIFFVSLLLVGMIGLKLCTPDEQPSEAPLPKPKAGIRRNG